MQLAMSAVHCPSLPVHCGSIARVLVDREDWLKPTASMKTHDFGHGFSLLMVLCVSDCSYLSLRCHCANVCQANQVYFSIPLRLAAEDGRYDIHNARPITSFTPLPYKSHIYHLRECSSERHSHYHSLSSLVLCSSINQVVMCGEFTTVQVNLLSLVLGLNDVAAR